MLRSAVSSLSSCPDPKPDESELSLTLAYVPQRLVSVATRCVLSEKSSGQTDEASIPYSARPDFVRNLYGSPILCDPCIMTITGPLPAAANAIQRSSDIVCDP